MNEAVKSILEDRCPALIDQVIDIGNGTASKAVATVVCDCGTQKSVNARSLYRRWENKGRYKCRPCHSGEYMKRPSRIEKWKKSVSKTFGSKSYRAKRSRIAKSLWDDPSFRQRQVDSHVRWHKENPEGTKRLVDAMRKAVHAKYPNHEQLIKARSCIRTESTVIELAVAAILDDFGIKYEAQFNLGYYRFDFHVPEHGLLIEVQGEYWHADTVAHDSSKASYASRMGYSVMHIWEHQFNALGEVRSILGQRLGITETPSVEFSLENVEIKRIETKDARIFLGQHHYLPAISKYGTHYGAFVGDRLVAVSTFSGVVRKQIATRLGLSTKEVLELSRFCIHPAYQKKNFASWFLSRAVKRIRRDKPLLNALVSFADQTMGHTGTIYAASGWLLDGETNPSYHYEREDRFIHKKTAWDRAKKIGVSENEYVAKHGYIKVPEKPKRRYILWLNTNHGTRRVATTSKGSK